MTEPATKDLPDIDPETINTAVAALLQHAGLSRQELEGFLDQYAADAREVLWAVEYPHLLRKLEIEHRVSKHAIEEKAKVDAELRQLRAQTARDAATIKRLQDMSVARLESHQAALNALNDENRALRAPALTVTVDGPRASMAELQEISEENRRSYAASRRTGGQA